MRNDLLPLNGRLPMNLPSLESQIRNLIAGREPQPPKPPVVRTETPTPTQTCDRITRIRENADGTREIEIRDNVRWYK